MTGATGGCQGLSSEVHSHLGGGERRTQTFALGWRFVTMRPTR